MSAGFPSAPTLFEELARAVTRFPRVGRHELYCHPSVYYAIQQTTIRRSSYLPGPPIDALFGADIIVAPELGEGIWELYSDKKLVDYGKVTT